MVEQEHMLSTDPRRPTYQRRSKGSLDLMRKNYDSRIQMILEIIERQHQEILTSLLGQTIITDPLFQLSDPTQERNRLLDSIEWMKQEVEYLRQCVTAVNNSVPKPKPTRKNPYPFR